MYRHQPIRSAILSLALLLLGCLCAQAGDPPATTAKKPALRLESLFTEAAPDVPAPPLRAAAARPAASGSWVPWDHAEQTLLAAEHARRSQLLAQQAAAQSLAEELEFAAFLRHRRHQDEQDQAETEQIARGTSQQLVAKSREQLQHLAAEEARSREEFHARGEAFHAEQKARKQRLKQQGAENERMFVMAVLGMATAAPAGEVAANGAAANAAAAGKASQAAAAASKAPPTPVATPVSKGGTIIDVKSWTDKLRTPPLPSGKDVTIIDVKSWTDKMRASTFDKWSQYENLVQAPGYWSRLVQAEIKGFQDSYVASSIVELGLSRLPGYWGEIISRIWSYGSSMPDALRTPTFPPRK